MTLLKAAVHEGSTFRSNFPLGPLALRTALTTESKL